MIRIGHVDVVRTYFFVLLSLVLILLSFYCVNTGQSVNSLRVLGEVVVNAGEHGEVVVNAGQHGEDRYQGNVKHVNVPSSLTEKTKQNFKNRTHAAEIGKRFVDKDPSFSDVKHAYSSPVNTEKHVYITPNTKDRQEYMFIKHIYKPPSMTEKQKDVIKKLTEPDSIYENDRIQNFSIKDRKLLRKHSKHELLPIYADWELIEKHVNETWFKPYQQGKGNYEATFKPTMTLKERVLMTGTLDVFLKACDWANVTWFLCLGSWLGSYRHHGLIPWDDDIDIAVKVSHWKKLYYTLLRIPGFIIHAPHTNTWKFFMKGLPKTVNYPLHFRWPFIDIFYYTENSEHVWGVTRMLNNHLAKTKKSDIYPLLMMPFEHTWASIPCNSLKLLSQRYKMKDCHTRWYNHKFERVSKSYNISCTVLHPALPFVFRKKLTNGSELEILKIGNRTVHTFINTHLC